MTHDTDNPERDPALAAAWREHSAEMPSAELDAAILAAAHRAVGSGPMCSAQRAAGAEAPDATRPQRWWMPLAAAATIGAVALGILQTVPEEPHVATHSASDMPAPAIAPGSPLREKLALDERRDAPTARPVAPPAPPHASAPAKPTGKVIAQSNTDSLAAAAASPAARSPAAPQPFPAETKRDADESGAAKDRASRTLATQPNSAPASEFQRRKENTVGNASEAAAEAPALARSPPPAAAPAQERIAAASDDKRQRNEVAQSAPAASGAMAMAKKTASAEQDAAMSGSAMKDAAKPIDVDAWIVRIRKLHDDGKLADAAKELVAMRAAVPDADRRLPAELRAWAATVKP